MVIFTKVHYINLSEIVLFVKASVIVISIHLKNQSSLWSFAFSLLKCPLNKKGKSWFRDPEKVSLFFKQRRPLIAISMSLPVVKSHCYMYLYKALCKICDPFFRICHPFLAQPLHHRKAMKAIQDPLPPGN